MPLRRRSRIIVFAVLAGVLVFAVAHFSDLLMQAGHSRLAMLDDVGFAVLATVAVLVYDGRRRRQIGDKLKLVSEMNHHVRNQLQIIQDSAYTTGDREHFARMQESVAHIDWALREILGKPGENGDTTEPPRSPLAAPDPHTHSHTPQR